MKPETEAEIRKQLAHWVAAGGVLDHTPDQEAALDWMEDHQTVVELFQETLDELETVRVRLDEEEEISVRLTHVQDRYKARIASLERVQSASTEAIHNLEGQLAVANAETARLSKLLAARGGAVDLVIDRGSPE